MPQALEQKPDVPDYLSVYIRAFSLLSSQRSQGLGGPEPLEVSEILVLASEWGMTEEMERDDFLSKIVSMDRVYRHRQQSRRKK